MGWEPGSCLSLQNAYYASRTWVCIFIDRVKSWAKWSVAVTLTTGVGDRKQGVPWTSLTSKSIKLSNFRIRDLVSKNKKSECTRLLGSTHAGKHNTQTHTNTHILTHTHTHTHTHTYTHTHTHKYRINKLHCDGPWIKTASVQLDIKHEGTICSLILLILHVDVLCFFLFNFTVILKQNLTKTME